MIKEVFLGVQLGWYLECLGLHLRGPDSKFQWKFLVTQNVLFDMTVHSECQIGDCKIWVCGCQTEGLVQLRNFLLNRSLLSSAALQWKLVQSKISLPFPAIGKAYLLPLF